MAFKPSEGAQSNCTYIEILDDDNIVEQDEQFTVKLSSSNPQVVLTNREATITIIDDDGESDEVMETEPASEVTTASEVSTGYVSESTTEVTVQQQELPAPLFTGGIIP